MLGFITQLFQFFTRLFGSSSERNIRKLNPYIEKIKDYYASLANISHDKLRQETNKLRNYLKTTLKAQKEELKKLKNQAAKSEDIKEKTTIFQLITQQEKEYYQALEKALLDILPQAFAIVKETARRFKEYTSIEVTANEFDHKIAEDSDYVTIEEKKAYWHTTWEVAGQELTWSMLHYDVQLIGGIVLHQGKIAEMGTGEGKTLVSTLPAFLNALSNEGVHIVTVNSYLAKRDAQWMAPLYQFHGISVDCIENYPSHSPERKKAYEADITYGTNSEFGFDYLRDNMTATADQQVQRGYHYAIVDEIDSVLIDDARTPLIISGPAKHNTHKEYRLLNPRVKQLYMAQKELVKELLEDAKKKIAAKNIEEGGVSLFRVYRALPGYKPFISFLSEKGIKQILSDTEGYFLQENSKLMPEADEPLFFTIDQKAHSVQLTDKGVEHLSRRESDKDFFVLPDMATSISAIENDTTLTKEESAAKKKKVIAEYSLKSARIHTVNQLLKAYALYEKNTEYVVLNKRVKLVDEKTGRILDGRRYSDGLHQAIEAKEGVDIKGASQTYATITPQNQFRMYRKLSGMTGTAITEATEMWEIYKLEVLPIPPNKPIIRKDLEDKIYKTEREKFNAVGELVNQIKESRRPVLIITPSVDVSERIRKVLNVPANRILNAKNHHLEAKIIAEAGLPGMVTISTQMAGRGTDIQVPADSREAGGLFVIIVEKSETRRVDDQAKGRTGRQGDPGTTVCFLSLEDPLIVHWKHGMIGSQVDKMFEKEGEVLEDSMISNAITKVQKAKEMSAFGARKRALEYDNVMDRQRKVIYQKRNHALLKEYLSLDVMHIFYESIKDAVLKDQENLKLELLDLLGTPHYEPLLTAELLRKKPRDLIKYLYKEVNDQQEAKSKKISAQLLTKIKELPTDIQHIVVPVMYGNTRLQVALEVAKLLETKGKSLAEEIQGNIILKVIDEEWTHHLQRMDDLKETARNATYEQKDPLLVYKLDSVDLFRNLLYKINKATCQAFINYQIIDDKISVQQKVVYEQIKGLMESRNKEEATISKPIRIENRIARNERVDVQYPDGTIKKGIKYKTVEKDIAEGKCTIVQHT